MARRLLRTLISGSRMLDWVFEQSASLRWFCSFVPRMAVRRIRFFFSMPHRLTAATKQIFHFYPEDSS